MLKTGQRMCPTTGSGIFLCLLTVLVALVTPAPAEAKRSVYTSNGSSNDVSAFDVGGGGALTQITGSPFAADMLPLGVAAAPDGRHLYVANSSSADLSAYAIATNGALAPVAGSPFPLVNTPVATVNPVGVTVTPDGDHIYVSNQGSANVAAFDVGVGGAVTPVTTSPFPAGTEPFGIATSPDGKHLYVGNLTSNDVSTYDIGASGELTEIAGSAFGTGGTGARGVAVTPDGKHLYVANDVSGNVSAFDVAPNGSLTPVTGSPFSGGGGPYGVAVTPDGKHLYVTNVAASSVSGYDIGGNGALTPITGSPFAAGTSPGAAVASPDGKHLYVTNFNSNNVTAYDIAGGGGLTQIAGSPFATGGSWSLFEAITITPDQPPVADFKSSPAPVGAPATFDASASSDSDGTVEGYDWDFGDGNTRSGAKSSVNHAYSSAGVYAVTLTATDDEGCSTAIVYTGQTTSCNGDPVAATTRSVAIPPKTKVSKAPKPKIKTTKKSVNVTVSFRSEQGATFKCKLDREAYKPCSSPYTVRAKSKRGKGKKHAISVRTAADGLDSEPVVIRFRVIRKRR